MTGPSRSMPPGTIPDKPSVVVPVAPAVLNHRFRHSLREGRVHPLLHAVQRYRREEQR